MTPANECDGIVPFLRVTLSDVVRIRFPFLVEFVLTMAMLNAGARIFVVQSLMLLLTTNASSTMIKSILLQVSTRLLR